MPVGGSLHRGHPDRTTQAEVGAGWGVLQCALVGCVQKVCPGGVTGTEAGMGCLRVLCAEGTLWGAAGAPVVWAWSVPGALPLSPW